MPDQHAAFGITRAMAGIAGGGSSRGGVAGVGGGGRSSGTAGAGNAGAFWRDLGLDEVVERGPTGGEEGVGVDFLLAGGAGAGAGGSAGAGGTGRTGGRKGRSGGGAYDGRGIGRGREEQPEQPIALAVRDKKTADDVRAR